jgi:serine/threonine-protein kinase SRPK3
MFSKTSKHLFSNHLERLPSKQEEGSSASSQFVIKRRDYEVNDRNSGYISEEEEDEYDYKPGGYHPVVLGSKYNNERYKIIRKLGWGHFSTVWLAYDEYSTDYVALKIVKSSRNYTEAALDEVSLLECVRDSGTEKDKGRSFVVRLIESFFHKGIHGNHICMVFEVLGDNLLTLIRRFRHRGIVGYIVKRITKQILLGLDYLHGKCGIIHTDLKPENVLIVVDKKNLLKRMRIDDFNDKNGSEKNEKLLTDHATSSRKQLINYYCDIRVKIADLGNACWIQKHFTNDIQTRQYRSPEVILEAPYDTSADIWSLACLVFELLTGDYLFDPEKGQYFEKNDDHLAQIIELLGPIPLDIALGGKYSLDYFNSNGKLRRIQRLQYWPLDKVLLDKYKYSAVEANEISSFLVPMLNVDKNLRSSAAESLGHSWISSVEI